MKRRAGLAAAMIRAGLLAAGLVLPTGGTATAQPVAATPLLACPAEGCRVGGGHYHVVMPGPVAAGKTIGAVIFFHGWQSSAEDMIADERLKAAAKRLGVALIAPDGMGRTWSYPGGPGRHRDEFAFIGAVLDDVTARFPIDPARIMASGFSQGASMTWYLACRMPERFAAFAAFSGAFWNPLPEECRSPRPKLVHFHGLEDAQVPIHGRRLRSGFEQGDVYKSLTVLARSCVAEWGPAEADGVLTCRVAAGCGNGPRLELCLHGGAHDYDRAWLDKAWRLTMAP